MQRFAKTLICLDFWTQISWVAVACLLGFVGVVIALVAGDVSEAIRIGGSVIAGVCFLGFVWWVANDARKYAKRLSHESDHQQKRVQTEIQAT